MKTSMKIKVVSLVFFLFGLTQFYQGVKNFTFVNTENLPYSFCHFTGNGLLMLSSCCFAFFAIRLFKNGTI